MADEPRRPRWNRNTILWIVTAPWGAIQRIAVQQRGRDRAVWPLWPRVVLGVIIIAALAAPLIFWRGQIAMVFADRAQVIAEIRDAGAWGPALLIGLYVAQVIVAPIPGQAINFVAGYIYGFWGGLGYSWIGAVLGSTAAMGLARLTGRPVVQRLVSRPLLERLDRLASGRGLSFFFVVFLVPGLPDDVGCFLAGLTRLPLPALIAAAALGRIPGIAAAVWAGASAERIGWPGWLALAGFSLAAAWIAWRHGERIQAWLLSAVWRPK
jgi:uncharacterized membrane protein YdjX (TVP38/TMEM64 family)